MTGGGTLAAPWHGPLLPPRSLHVRTSKKPFNCVILSLMRRARRCSRSLWDVRCIGDDVTALTPFKIAGSAPRAPLLPSAPAPRRAHFFAVDAWKCRVRAPLPPSHETPWSVAGSHKPGELQRPAGTYRSHPRASPAREPSNFRLFYLLRR